MKCRFPKMLARSTTHLAQLLSGKLYSSLREGGKKVFSGVPPIKELLKRTEEHIKGMVVPGTLFEEAGL
ncbi:1-deoxy-D-xylulose-5-phosphate synthase [Escherichia coli]|uniref:1-deoxy-D-xylulose-5-phosphate synthase n=1 Tax=Escherichia coli TaxID=562 RepID=A0A376MS71_ECOLX|nr:1-deoxy-D-xylulose-5-phosphate synthase [Escherichia coli]